MPVSRLDTVYRKVLLSKFFTKGWGRPENLNRLFAFRKLVSNRDTCFDLVSKDHPITIINRREWSDCQVIEGKFISPFAVHLPEIVPQEVQDAYFQMILPLTWKKSDAKPICIHLAGTGDHYFWRRRTIMAKPLLKHNIGALLLENPYYGLRKPKDQIRSSLHNVSDIFVMGGCIILECLALLHFCERLGLGPLGISGLSMGGHMASLAATNWPKPLVLVPCLSWSTASAVFTEGVMSDSIDWNLLQNQFTSNSLYHDDLANLVRIVDQAFCDDNPMRYVPNNRDLNDLVNIEQNNGDNVMFNYQSGIVPQKMNDLIKMPMFINKKNKSKKRKPPEAVHFMKGIMDECTHLKNFSVPFDTSLIIAVCAKADGYVPREGCSSLEDIWPGATIKYVDAGHVSAYILYRKFFRRCIVEAFEKAKLK